MANERCPATRLPPRWSASCDPRSSVATLRSASRAFGAAVRSAPASTAGSAIRQWERASWGIGHHVEVQERTPADGIARHRDRLRTLSDEGLLAELRATEPLPQENDDAPAWDDEATSDRVEFVIAAANELGERRLVEAIKPLFELASLGDAYEMMQGLRHGPGKAVRPHFHLLTPIMLDLVRSTRPGCRRWAARELGVLRDPAAGPALLDLTRDSERWVRDEACNSLLMVAAVGEPDQRTSIEERLREIGTTDSDEMVRNSARYGLSQMSGSRRP